MIPLGSQLLFCVDNRLLGLVISNDWKFCLRIGVVSELVPYPSCNLEVFYWIVRLLFLHSLASNTSSQNTSLCFNSRFRWIRDPVVVRGPCNREGSRFRSSFSKPLQVISGRYYFTTDNTGQPRFWQNKFLTCSIMFKCEICDQVSDPDFLRKSALEEFKKSWYSLNKKFGTNFLWKST